MDYDFDEIIDRRGSGCLKWDTAPSPHILCMWVADMDFAAPPPIVSALKNRIQHPVFGYSAPPKSYYQSVADWLQRRHNWNADVLWFSHCPGVVAGLHFLTKCLVAPGNKILMSSPVYYPFFNAAHKNNIAVAFNRLIYEDGRYKLNFEEFEALAKDPDVKVFFLCSPHNPGGRMWTKQELLRMGRICVEHDVLIVSDELHSDLVISGNTHYPIASLSEDIAHNSITFVAPSKTFNLAGLQTSITIIPNPGIKKIFDDFTSSLGITRPNVFGITALTAAYNECDEWLDALLVYLKENVAFFTGYVTENIPEIKVMTPQAGYLVWFDFSGLGVDSRVFHQELIEKGKLWLDEGYIFGEAGEGFERINVACPRKILEKACEKLKDTVDYLKACKYTAADIKYPGRDHQ